VLAHIDRLSNTLCLTVPQRHLSAAYAAYRNALQQRGPFAHSTAVFNVGL